MGDGRCPFCKRQQRKRNTRGLLTGTCGKEACRRAQRAEQKRLERDRKANAPVPVPVAPDGSQPVTTPWGEYPDHKAAWIDVFDNGKDWQEFKPHREWAEDHLAQGSCPTLEEFLDLEPIDAEDSFDLAF